MELLIHGLLHLVLFMHGLHIMLLDPLTPFALLMDPVPKGLIDIIHLFLRFLTVCRNMGLIGQIAQRIFVMGEFLILRSLELLLLLFL